MIDVKEFFGRNHPYIRDFRGRFHRRKDINAFLLLDTLCPGQSCVIIAAEHDKIWLEFSAEAISEVATEEDLLELAQCGVCYDTSIGVFYMYV